MPWLKTPRLTDTPGRHTFSLCNAEDSLLRRPLSGPVHCLGEEIGAQRVQACLTSHSQVKSGGRAQAFYFQSHFVLPWVVTFTSHEMGEARRAESVCGLALAVVTALNLMACRSHVTDGSAGGLGLWGPPALGSGLRAKFTSVL